MTTYTLDDLIALGESVDVEFKKAAGRDGRGELPKDFWPSFAAMANTAGGEIFLGVEESGESLVLHNLTRGHQLRQEIFNLAANKQKVSASLLRDQDVDLLEVDGHCIVRVRVPRASRRQKPVYVGENPLKGTYERRHEGDFLLGENAVRRLIAEQSEHPRDSIVLPNYAIDDLDLESVSAYRQIFTNRTPTHPFVSQALPEFLRSIQAYKKDRETGSEGLTLAGVLMFGKLNAILDAVPNYIVDYQERPEARTEARWVDRITTDGSWSGNLFDFYRRVLPKLIADLKAPFRLEGMVRQGASPIHEALQEALVNSLVHADFSGRVSILVVKRPDMFGFRNPGLMRVPIEQAIRGGDSDCRNRLIQKMFQFVGAGDQAGSGVPRIFGVWKEQSWRSPVVHEKREPDQTLFELRMASLLPDDVVGELETLHGERFRALSAVEKLVLVTAAMEVYVDHKRVRELTDEHPADVSKILAKLAREGLLVQSGHGRGTMYFDPAEVAEVPRLDLDGPFNGRPAAEGAGEGVVAAISSAVLQERGGAEDENSGVAASRSGLLEDRSGLLEERSGPLQRAKALVSQTFPRGIPGKLDPEPIRALIVSLCSQEALTLRELSQALERVPDFLRKRHVRPLLEAGQLTPEFPDRRNHPSQRYRAAQRNKE